MSVSDLQTWADNLEYVRLPAIEADISDLTAAQAIYSGELNAKAQELTDRLDAHDARITAAQTDATSASEAASAVSTEVYGARLDATTYTNQKHQEALDAIQASNTDIRSYLDFGFAAYLQTLINDSDALLSDEVNAALNEAFNARNALNQELIDIGLINDQLLDEQLPAINQDLQDSLIRLVGLEYFNAEMFGGMQFPDIQALHDKLAGEVQNATDIASEAANGIEVRTLIDDIRGKEIPKLLNNVTIDNAIFAARDVSHLAQTIVAKEEVGDTIAMITNDYYTKVDADLAVAGELTTFKAELEDPNGTSLGATLVQDYYTKVSTDNAIAVAKTNLKSEIEDPNGTSIGAQLVNEYRTEASTDLAISSATTALKTEIENPNGTSLGATLVNQYRTETSTNQAIADANATLKSEIEDPNGTSIGATLVNQYRTEASTDLAISAATTALKSQIEDPLGTSIGATLVNQYRTEASTDLAIADATTALKSDIEDPNGTSIGATLVNQYRTEATTDLAISEANTNLKSEIEDPLGTSVGAQVSDIQTTKVDAAGAVSAVETEISATYGDMTALATATQQAKATADGIEAGFVWRLNGSNAMELFSVSDGSGGNTVTQKLDANYVEITGIAQIQTGVITDLVSTTAFIENLGVDTINLAGNSVTATDFVKTEFDKIGDGFFQDVLTASINVPPQTLAEFLISANFSHSYFSGARDWGFQIRFIVDGVWESISFRDGMVEPNDYPNVSLMHEYHNTTDSPKTIYVMVRWKGEDLTLELNKEQTTLSIVARWR